MKYVLYGHGVGTPKKKAFKLHKRFAHHSKEKITQTNEGCKYK